MAVEDKNKYGQYFTPKDVANFMVSLLDIDKKGSVLEPSCGEGVFLDALKEAGYKDIEGIEFDKSCAINTQHKVTYGDYLLNNNLAGVHDAIIGNPPYIRWKNLSDELKVGLKKSIIWNEYCSSLSDYSTAFIAKAAIDLREGGNLVFITPEYWLYTYHSQKLRNLLISLGSIDRIYHFDEAPIFEGAIASLVVFRFVKSKSLPATAWKILKPELYTGECLPVLAIGGVTENFEKIRLQKFALDKRWTLEKEDVAKRLNLFEDACSADDLLRSKNTTIGDVCDIANGMVSGLDKAFQIDGINLTDEEESKTIRVAKAKQLDGIRVKETTKYIFITEKISEDFFIENYPNFYSKLLPLKSDLLKRYDYKKGFSEYWYWSFLRNYSTFKRNEIKIFIPCKERIGSKTSFRFTLAEPGIFPTQDVSALVPKVSTRESVHYIHAFLKLSIVTEWIKSRGVLRGGIAEFSEAPLSSIPFRKVNWGNASEIAIHDEIVRLATSSKDSFENNQIQIEAKFRILLT